MGPPTNDTVSVLAELMTLTPRYPSIRSPTRLYRGPSLAWRTLNDSLLVMNSPRRDTAINRRAVTVCEPASSSAGQKVRHRPVELIRALARRPMTAIFEDAQLRIRKAFVRSSRPFGRHRSVALAVH